MTRIGWLQDQPGYTGGAELSAQMLRESAPEWAEIVECLPETDWPDVEAYVIGNCSSYSRGIIPLLDDKPVVKIVGDIWRYGDLTLKHWLLQNAAQLVLKSPCLLDWLNVEVHAPVMYLPGPVELEPFEQAARRNSHRLDAALWLGRLEVGKGIENAIAWAEAEERDLHIYGYGSLSHMLDGLYRGVASQEFVPALMAEYRTFVFLPDEYDACPRSVLEAWSAGCQLVVNGRQGATWWIENDPDVIDASARTFWERVREVSA